MRGISVAGESIGARLLGFVRSEIQHTRGAATRVLSKVSLKVYRFLWGLIRRRRFLNARAGGATLRTYLVKLSSGYLARAVPNPMQVDGHIVFHGFDSEDALRIATGSYEPETSALIRKLLRPGQIFVDVGAHIGHFVLVGARVVGPTGRVYAFEPAPANFGLLAKNVEVNGYRDSVTMIPLAVSDISGTCPLFVSTADSMWHTILPTWGGNTIEVPTTSLDGFFEQQGWPPIDLIKMDIEGAEKTALKGMETLSRQNPGLKLIVEFASGNIPPADDPEDVFQVIRNLGFVRMSIIARELIRVESFREMVNRVSNTGATGWWTNLLCEK